MGSVMRIFLAMAVVALGIGATAPLQARAQAPEAPDAYVTYLGDQVINKLSTDEPRAQRVERFKSIMERHLALDAIARFVTGRYWERGSAEERARFRASFKTLLVNRFLPAFAGQSDVDLEVLETRKVGERLWVVQVRVHQPDVEPTSIALRLLEANGALKVVDIVTQGISLGLTLREEYTTYLKNHDGDMNALIGRIEARSRELAS